MVNAEFPGSENFSAVLAGEQVSDIHQMATVSDTALAEIEMIPSYSHTGQLKFQLGAADPAIFIQMNRLDFVQEHQSDAGLPVHHTEW